MAARYTQPLALKSKEDVDTIFKLRKQGSTLTAIGKKLGVSIAVIASVLNKTYPVHRLESVASKEDLTQVGFKLQTKTYQAQINDLEFENRGLKDLIVKLVQKTV